jgi:hypothetical protein
MEINRKLCLLIYKWCKTKFGKSKFRKTYPKIYFRHHARKSGNIGPLKGEYFYDTNIIYVYGEMHYWEDDPLLDVINTIIHEYKHFLQDMNKYDMYFDKYYYSYRSHPYEVTCNRFASKEQYECYYYILQHLKKKKKAA